MNSEITQSVFECQLRKKKSTEILTHPAHLYDKTSEEVQSSNTDKQHFVVHVGDIVQLKCRTNKWTRIQHQPGHHTEQDDHQTEENDWEQKREN